MLASREMQLIGMKAYLLFPMQTTERRMIELNMYMAAILSMPTNISESDIIYTFFHCLIRDEQDLAKLSEGKSCLYCPFSRDISSQTLKMLWLLVHCP